MKRIDSLTTYVRECIALRDHADDLWYRGIKDSSLSVSPGLYWRGFEKEWDLTSGFLAQAPQFLSESQLVRFSGELELLQIHDLALFPELPVLAGRLLARAVNELRREQPSRDDGE